MKVKQKKYPILISTIISCVVVIVSLFILGFFGMNMSVSLGGGSCFEVYAESTEQAKEYLSASKTVLKNYGLSVDSSFVEDKYVYNSENEAGYTSKVLVVKIATKDLIDEEKQAIHDDLVQALGVSDSDVSEILSITSSTQGKSVLYIALGYAIVAVCFFVFAWIRYNIFAGISFIIAYLHNIIFFLSLIILTRVQLSVISLMVALVLTLMMSVIMVSIYEKYREVSTLQQNEKTPSSELMISCEKQALKPYFLIGLATVVVFVVLMILPANSMVQAGLGVLLALISSLYTTVIIGPGSYSAVLEIREMNQKAILSRNDKVNKHIKTKIRKKQEEKEKLEKAKLEEKTETVKAAENETKDETKQASETEKTEIETETAVTKRRGRPKKNTSSEDNNQ